MNGKGFSLIELMIYLTVLLFLMYHCIPWSITLFLRYNAHHVDAQRMIDCCVLHDLFIKDVFEGSRKKNKWFFLSSTHLVWQKNDKSSVGWLYENNNLYRITGFFNETTQMWHKKHTIPVLYDASEILFRWDSDAADIYRIYLEIEVPHKRYSLMGAPRYANE